MGKKIKLTSDELSAIKQKLDLLEQENSRLKSALSQRQQVSTSPQMDTAQRYDDASIYDASKPIGNKKEVEAQIEAKEKEQYKKIKNSYITSSIILAIIIGAFLALFSYFLNNELPQYVSYFINKNIFSNYLFWILVIITIPSIAEILFKKIKKTARDEIKEWASGAGADTPRRRRVRLMVNDKFIGQFMVDVISILTTQLLLIVLELIMIVELLPGIVNYFKIPAVYWINGLFIIILIQLIFFLPYLFRKILEVTIVHLNYAIDGIEIDTVTPEEGYGIR